MTAEIPGAMQRAIVRAYRDELKSSRAVGREFKVSHQTVLNVLRRYGIPSRPTTARRPKGLA